MKRTNTPLPMDRRQPTDRRRRDPDRAGEPDPDTDRPRVAGSTGLLAPLVLRFVTTALDVELREHLGYDRHDAAGWGTGNSRNGMSPKIVATDIGSLEIRVPRDRCGTFTPLLIPKRLRQLPHLGATTLLLYASGIPPRLAAERIVSLYHCAGSHPDTRLAALVVRAGLHDVYEWRLRRRPSVERVLVDKMRLTSPAGPITLYTAVGQVATGGADVYGMWAAPTAATRKPAPEALVSALRRAIDSPLTVHVHPATDTVELVHRAWPRADVSTDVQRRLHNPFREREQRSHPLPTDRLVRPAVRRASLLAG